MRYSSAYTQALLAGLLLLMASCHSTRAIVAAVPQPLVPRIDTLADRSQVLTEVVAREHTARIPYRTWAAHIGMDYSDGSMSQHFTASVRMRRDSLCWISFQGLLGIEGLRVLVTPDSIHIINRLRHEYTVQPLSYISSLVPLPASMAMAQRFILGYLLLEPADGLQYQELVDSLYMLRVDKPQYRYDAWLYPNNCTSSRHLLKDLLVRREMDITFDEYGTVAGKPIATARTIKIKDGHRDINIILAYSRIRVDEALDFPFEISRGMTRVSEIRF
jgi:Domain of unknown function (DUF4292)